MNKEISRREFLKKTSGLLSTLLFLNILSPFTKRIFAKNNTMEFNDKTVLHLEGKDIDPATINKMVEEGFRSLGGINKIIKRGMNVVIKPNIGFNSAPERAHNSNPYLVEAVARQCIGAGAKVRIFDRSTYSTKLCYRTSRIKEYGEKAGAEVVYMDDRKFKKVKVINGLNLKTLEVYDDLLKADFVINIPIAKDHAAATLTMAMKNLMGCIGGFRGSFHVNLHKNIVDFNKAIPVHLVIMDATRILTDHGPGSGTAKDVKIKKSIVFSKSALTVDAYSAKTFFNINPGSIDYIKLAHGQIPGEFDLKKIKVHKKRV